jgi:hypothetical protein
MELLPVSTQRSGDSWALINGLILSARKMKVPNRIVLASIEEIYP